MATVTKVEDQLFLDYLKEWLAGLKPFSLAQEIREPRKAAVFSADMVAGFCVEGALASPRVGRLIEPVVQLFRRAHDHGVRHFVLLQDTHHPQAPEFKAFPPHCLRGSKESQTISQLVSLSFAKDFVIVEKNSLHSAVGTTFNAWLGSHPEVREAIVVGDCTDLCTYNLAMHLRLWANAYNLDDMRVIVPANAVETYDLPAAKAREIGAMPHPGDFFHQVFLYHLALNGCQVVSKVV